MKLGISSRAELAQLDLEHAARDAEALARGRFGPDWKLDFEGRTDNFSLADLDMATRAQLSGDLGVTARVTGTADRLVSTCLQGVYQSHQATAAACL